MVILSTADANAAVWTNKQHIAVRLSESHQVFYINSLGLRAPRLSRNDLSRIVRRIAGVVSGGTRQMAFGEAVIITPIVLPFHSIKVVRALNYALVYLTVQIRLPRRYHLWTFSPLTYGLEKHSIQTVYHCVDLLHSLPGVPTAALLSGERRLLASADEVIASSRGVAQHLRGVGGGDVQTWENVADVALFSKAREGRDPHQRVKVLFAGNLTPTKINIRLLQETAELGVQVVLAGPLGIDGATLDRRLEELLSHPNVDYAGVVSQDKLASLCAECSVGLIPYNVNDYTVGVFPMKVFEYLAAGLQVVSTRLPSLVEIKQDGLVCVADDDFTSAIVAVLDKPSPRIPSGEHSWDSRLKQIRAVLDGRRT